MNIFLKELDGNNDYNFLLKTDLTIITTLCTFNVFSKVKSSSKSVLIFNYL